MSSTTERNVKKKETASVIPVKRKLVKSMAGKAIISVFSSSCSNGDLEPNGDNDDNSNGGRVYPTRP
ncbi:unnamed protein product [Cochlearia groenlandica]